MCPMNEVTYGKSIQKRWNNSPADRSVGLSQPNYGRADHSGDKCFWKVYDQWQQDIALKIATVGNAMCEFSKANRQRIGEKHDK